MGRRKSRRQITAFTSDGEYLAILSPNSNSVKVWNVKDQSLLAEWEQSDSDADLSFTCLALNISIKKRRKRSFCWLALGTNDGNILAIDAFTKEMKWKSEGNNLGGLVGLSFTSDGGCLYAVGTHGMVVKMNRENGETVHQFKVTDKPISTVAFSCGDEVLGLDDGETRLISLEKREELSKFLDNLGPLQHISLSADENTIVTFSPGDKYLQVWTCDASSTIGKPTKIRVKVNATGINAESAGRLKSSPIIAARLDAVQEDNRLTLLVAHGSVDSPRFSPVNINNIGEDLVVTADYGTEGSQEVGVPVEEAAVAPKKDVKPNKKRPASDADNAIEAAIAHGDEEPMDGGIEDDLNEPTMGEKIEKLNLLDEEKRRIEEKQETSSLAQPPSADSVIVLLRQALRADDRALLLDCLYTQDEKVIANSLSLLNPSDVLKLLQFLISTIQSRGAVVACALPWLRRLLLQHAGGIMSHESSFVGLNSLYQLIESRVSTFKPALQLSSSLDLLYSGVLDTGDDEDVAVKPVIYEDTDSEEEESLEEDAMETDQESAEEEATGVLSDGLDDDELAMDNMSE